MKPGDLLSKYDFPPVGSVLELVTHRTKFKVLSTLKTSGYYSDNYNQFDALGLNEPFSGAKVSCGWHGGQWKLISLPPPKYINVPKKDI